MNGEHEPRPVRLLRAPLFSLSLADARTTLWLEGTHVVHVRTGGYVERRKRIALHDIQAIVVTGTRWRGLGNALLIALLLLTGVGIFAAGIAEPVSGVLCVLAVLLLLLLAINHFRGPACTTQIYTAVQQEDLPGCRRMKRALLLLEKLRPEIARVQGPWPAE